jgi:hypothetical protein
VELAELRGQLAALMASQGAEKPARKAKAEPEAA